jgi:hypothetical protein
MSISGSTINTTFSYDNNGNQTAGLGPPSLGSPTCLGCRDDDCATADCGTREYQRLESEMSLQVKKTAEGLYEACATPPHVKTAWSTAAPVPTRQLIEELKSRGCHQQDIGDALYEQDPDWVEKL